ncbi:hypothetical protein A1O7_02929 [Cladophialophora yegresii CBS 114405]|uniref:DNA (cytosine-5-)-methyltransferase n=1 Tax=Cladophialophora yegresii CBS 114405 TaxID=1182544 RepID=W9WD49_9EURO|nr:uncharacterized protein A1O7_02929 [Cladophialophora yegresii CBS 114405]EXJ62491.1 hypothetical protein A1O7_02929 [Cladophialophora yegresii CBS 114405]
MDWLTGSVTSQRGAGDLSNLPIRQLVNLLLNQQPQATYSSFPVPHSAQYRNNEKLTTSASVSDSDGELINQGKAADDDELEIIKIQPVPKPVPKPTAAFDARDPAPIGPLVLDPGCDVELQDHSFLTITETSAGRLTGRRLLLQNHYELLMPERSHELVQLVDIDTELDRKATLWEVPIDAAIRNCKIIYTNQQYNQLNYDKDVSCGTCDEDGKHIYFCRYTSGYTNVGLDGDRPSSPPKTGRIEHLRFHQVQNGTLITRAGQHIQLRIPDAEVRKQWRGEANCVLGGSHTDQYDGVETKMYTFADAFAGAGGTSWGAYTADLKMKFAFDLDQRAIDTYRHNFGDTGMQVLHMDVHDFVKQAASPDNVLADTSLVDILHMSPPCQPFCGANRTPNLTENARNLEAFGRVADLLEVCKPRIATLEESKSITDVDKRQYFKQLIGFFIEKGYSVQWKVLHLECWGVPQTRKRLIVIASGPGEKLPTMVKPTHGSGPGLKPLAGIWDAIGNIPDDALHHGEMFWFPEPRLPYDGNGLCPTIMTKPKSKQYHPNGLRRFTVRELAALQTFPHSFEFLGSIPEKQKQVGNAVPTVFSEIMFRDVRHKLWVADLAELAELRKAAEARKVAR